LVVEVFGRLEAVFDQEVEVVPLVEDLAVDVGVVLAEETYLSILLGDELLVHRRDLDEEVLVGDVEVGCEELRRFAVVVELDREGGRLVVPVQPVEIEESGELPLTVVSERDLIGRRREVEGQFRPPCVLL
jgi:hypothetical protein